MRGETFDLGKFNGHERDDGAEWTCRLCGRWGWALLEDRCRKAVEDASRGAREVVPQREH